MEPVITNYSLRSSGHYVPAIKHNGLVYVSGQLSVDPETGQVVPGGIKAEVRQALLNMERVLKAAGTDKSNVIHCRLYIADVAYWSELNEVYAEFFGGHKPARAVVPSGSLHYGCLVEIEAIAACEGGAQ